MFSKHVVASRARRGFASQGPLTIRLLLPACLLAAVVAADTVTGVTKPFRDATLSATVPGSVVKILVKPGDRVKKDDVLVQLDSRLEELEVVRRKQQAESKAEIEAATARVATLKTDLEGTRRLFDSTKSVSREDLDKKTLEFQLAEAELHQLEVTENREQIEYEMAQAQLDKRSVKAPFDGVVTKINIEEGEICQPDRPLLRLVDVASVYFIANIEARLAHGLRVGQDLAVHIENDGTPLERTGKVEFVSPVVDAASGLQEVRVLFANPDGTVRPGLSGTVELGTTPNEK